MSRLRRNYTYTVGDVVNALPNYTLTCTKAGITSADPITVQEGTIIDGTCEWSCVNNVGGGGGGAVEDWEAGKIYKVNQLVKSDSKLYICMNEHTSSSAFATDLLTGNWTLIGGAGYSNVIMDTIYEGDVQVTAIDNTGTYTLTSSADNYDYAICTVKITFNGGLYGRATTVVPANQSSVMGWTYGVGAPRESRVYGWIGFTADKTSIRFALWEKGSNASSASLERVDAIKVNTMTLSEIAELSMPSNVSVIEPVPTTLNVNHKFTAQGTGYYWFGVVQTKVTQTIVISFLVDSVDRDTLYVSGNSNSPARAWMSTTFPVVKGQQVTYIIWTSDNNPPEHFEVKFIYSIGSAKELGLV